MSKTKRIISVVFFVFSFLPAFFTPAVHAGAGDNLCDTSNDLLGLDCVKGSGLTADDPRTIATRIINVSLGLLGMVATVLIVYAGFLWMTAGGNDEQAGKARSIIAASVIGLVIILSAYAISRYVLESLYAATQGNPYNVTTG